MKHHATALVAAMLAWIVTSGPAAAHHAARMFELTTPLRVKGTVVRYTWANPHSVIIVDEKIDGGKTIRWALESSAPIRGLEMRGFSKDSFKAGDVIEACGFAPRNGVGGGADPSAPNTIRYGPGWLENADRVITARLLLTRDGAKEGFSRYGPLELCTQAGGRAG